MTKIFVIEGVDGCGKTTICKKLSNKNKWKYLRTPEGIFRQQNYKIESFGDKSLAYIYFLSAVLNTSFLIKNNLKHRKTIICDRYYPTLKVYYNAINFFPKFINFKNLPIIKPNKIVHIYVDYKQIKERLKRKKTLSLDELKLMKSKIFYTRLVEEYRKECDIEINATDLSIEDIIEKLKNILI